MMRLQHNFFEVVCFVVVVVTVVVVFAKRSPSQSKSIPIGLDVDGITFAIFPPYIICGCSTHIWLESTRRYIPIMDLS